MARTYRRNEKNFEYSGDIKKDFLRYLDERTLQILGLYFYYEFTLHEIGHSYGLTHARIQQIIVQALEKIKKIYNHYHFEQVINQKALREKVLNKNI